jgi:hypothetical protein
MALTVTATAGVAGSNSYAAVADATTYLEGRLDTTVWDTLTTTEKGRALVQASALLDSLPIGHPAHGDNLGIMRFPTALCETDAGVLFIPTEVRDATIELALAYVAQTRQGSSQLAAQRAAGVQSMSEGKLSVTFSQAAAVSQGSQALTILGMAPVARDLLGRRNEYNNYRGWLLPPGRRTIM